MKATTARVVRDMLANFEAHDLLALYCENDHVVDALPKSTSTANIASALEDERCHVCGGYVEKVVAKRFPRKEA